MIFYVKFIFLHDWKHQMIIVNISFTSFFLFDIRLKFTFQSLENAICRLFMIEKGKLRFHAFASEHLKAGRTSKFCLIGFDLNFSLFNPFTLRYISVYITLFVPGITLELNISDSFLRGFYSFSVLT